MTEKWSGAERRKTHECQWLGEDGLPMVPAMWNDHKNRKDFRTRVEDKLFKLTLWAIGNIVVITSGAFVWSSNIRADIQGVNSSIEKSNAAIQILAETQKQHQFILQKYIGALMDARMESQKKLEYEK